MDRHLLSEKDLKTYPQYFHGFDSLVKHSDVESLEAENKRLKEYARHKHGCGYNSYFKTDCTCGLTQTTRG